ncbi:MAG TPA: LytR family transcriptional regulator, partial [Kribbella sp.]|nr:LytR family transcriptional regulator [Kribbella sp.]
IPGELLGAFVQLGLKVKNAKVTNIDLDKEKNFPSGKDPDYKAMQKIVQKSLNPPAPTTKPTVKPTKKPTTSTSKKPTPKKTATTPGTAENLADACAYNPSETGTGN